MAKSVVIYRATANNVCIQQVVETPSASIGHAEEDKESIDDDHLGMAKFTGVDDEGYKQVSGAIEGYVDDIIRTIASSGHAANDTCKYSDNLILSK